jgi:peroxiredoxin
MRPAIGDPAPAIDLPTHDGQRWRLVDAAGRPVLLVFHRLLA